MDSSTTVLEAQADWLTMAVHSGKATERLGRSVRRWLAYEVALDNKTRPFRLMGYQGTQAGRVRWGKKQNAGLVQLSGQLAADHFLECWNQRDTLTRIDLAVTVRTPVLDDDLARRHYAEAVADRAGRPLAAMPSLVQDDNHGSTFYLGHRTSDFYLRVYNKQRECEANSDLQGAAYYANCWRYELECKGAAAANAASKYASRPDADQFTRAYVHDYASRHGLAPIFTQDGPAERAIGFRRRSDRESRLDWLNRSVRPAVRWLLDNGDRAEVLQALDLAEELGPSLDP